MSAYLKLRKATAVKFIAAAAAALACLISAPQNAKADAMDWFTSDYENCMKEETSGNLSCTICGVKYECGSSGCSWGAFKDINPQTMSGGEAFALYCLGSGGVITPSGQAVGVQNISMSKAFTVLGKDKLGGKDPSKAPDGGAGKTAPDTIGAMAEYSGDTDGNSKAFGIVLPLGWTFFFGDDDLLDVNGNIIYSHLSSLDQFGFNANPIYLHSMYFDENNYRLTLGASVPVQLVGTFVEDSDNGLSWLIGAGFIGGALSRRVLGRRRLGRGRPLRKRLASADANRRARNLRFGLRKNRLPTGLVDGA